MSEMMKFDESIAQMKDPEHHALLMAKTFAERHPCPVDDCRLSAEEHHRLSFGVLSELAYLRRKVRDYEQGIVE